AAAVRARGTRARVSPTGHPDARALLRRRGSRAAPCVSRGRPRAAGGSRGGTIVRMALEFAERIRRIPVYPVAAGYDLGADMAMLASNESCFAPAPGVVEAAQRALAGAHRYPDPSYAGLGDALSDRYGIPDRKSVV